MQRTGMSLTFRVLIIGVILLALGVIVLGGFRGGWSGFEQFVGGNERSSSINTCESQVDGFCQQADSGQDWAARYPHCEQYKSTIDSGETTCPLEPSS